MPAPLKNPPGIIWNDACILARAGRSPEGVRSLMEQYNQPLPTQTAVYQWVSRGIIPDRWRPALVYALLASNRITMDDLFAARAKAQPENVPGAQPEAVQ